MAHFALVTQHPKPKDFGIGSLSIGKDGEADFFEGNAETNARVLARMVRVRIESAAAAQSRGQIGLQVNSATATLTGQGIRRGQRMVNQKEMNHLYPNRSDQFAGFCIASFITAFANSNLVRRGQSSGN